MLDEMFWKNHRLDSSTLFCRTHLINIPAGNEASFLPMIYSTSSTDRFSVELCVATSFLLNIPK